MYDSGNNGWGGNGALRITVNGTDIAIAVVKVYATAADNTPNNQKAANTYTFTATIGDTIQIYWVAGAVQNENSFIAYYTDTPPIPSFTAANNATWDGANAVLYKLRGTMNTTKNGALFGTITVEG